MDRAFKNNIKSVLWVIFLFIIIINNSNAQTCTEKLKQAEDEFEEGHLYEIQGLLDQCIQQGFSRDEKIRAYRLLTISFLFLDQFSLADQNYLELLKINPEFKPNPLTDPSELLFLHKKFITNPSFSLVLMKAGTNLTFINTLVNFTLDGSINLANKETDFYNNEISREVVSYLPGFEIGSGIDYRLNKKFDASVELLISYNRIKRQERSLGISNLSFQEAQWFVKMPFSIKYTFEKPRLKPYIYSGFSLDFLLNSIAGKLERVVSIISVQTDSVNSTQDRNEVFDPISDPNINLNDKRNWFNYSVLVGAGIKYKIGIDYLAFDVRYSYGLNNISNRDARYAPNDPLLFKYWYVDDDFRQNYLSFSVSFIKPLYNPRKILK